MTLPVTQPWIDFISDVSYDDLPADVVKQTKLYILDNLACALGGYAIDWGKKVTEAGCDLGGGPESTAIGSGKKLGSANAAYVNGKLSNILDMDEVFYSTRHIGGVPVFPALSLGESKKASGKDIIVATALAYDFAARCSFCGMIFLPDPEKVMIASNVSTMAFCTISAAVAAAKILKLDRGGIEGTLTMAAHFSPGPIESKMIYYPTFTKYGDMGWFCLSGVIAAQLGQHGYNGDPTIFDGERGLKQITGALEFDVDTFIEHLGTRWYIMDAGIKPYPTCRWFHTGVKLLEDIIRTHRLEPDDIEKISVNGTFLVVALPTWVKANRWYETEDKELWHSQFSFAYALACTAYGITPGPDWAKPETLADPRLAEMTRKISHGQHPESLPAIKAWTGHPAKMHCKTPTSIEVHTRKGTFSAESWDMPGDSWNPQAKLGDADFIAKFRNNACHVLGDSKIEMALDLIQNLDSLDDITQLMAQMSP